MLQRVETDPGLVAGEHEVLAFWETARAFEKLRAKVAGGPKWSFIDGPITANNPMGVHHAWGRTYKDAFQRYFAMCGFDQRFQNGFDCQGLWVEVEAEKELGFGSKKDIEEYGVERFIDYCKERVLRYAAVQTQQSVRLGMWMDWDNSYYTMSDENNYTIWSFLKRCHERGLIYKGLDAMPWCPRCGTAISEQERKEGYKLIEDDSLYVRFPLRGKPGEYLLAWTTTPWTLAANVAAAVSPDLIYVKAKQGDATYYLAESRLEILSSNGEAEVVDRLPGAQMVGWAYDGPFDDLPGAAAAVAVHQVIAWEEVDASQGTGIVHIAPGCGKEDFDLGKQLGLPVVAPIDEGGNYAEGFGFLTGRNAAAVAPEVYEDLKRKDLFYKSERYTHDYPHCWRCGTALLFRAVDEWYIDMSWRDEIAANARKIRWIPDYGLDLELDWLKNMGDWMISKKRYWGLALPIWECTECGAFDVVGGREELQRRAVEGWDEFAGDPSKPNSPHRPWIDAVKIACQSCGAKASRIPDVGNPWLDAGIVPYSTTGYSTDRENWSQWVPADFVVESFPGQFRNWFYALLAMSTMMEDIPPFKTLLGHASVRDEHGEEMHKSKGNAIGYDEAAERIGSDVMRWMYCRHTPTNNLNFGYGIAQQIERKMFGTLWNTYAFFANYARLDGFDPSAPEVPVAERPEIDRWLLSNLQMLVASSHRNFGDHWLSPFVRQAEDFIEELSNWYVRRNRRRFWRGRTENDRDKLAAYQTLYATLTTLCKLLAPIIPFVTERIYQNLRTDSDPESIHLSDYPTPDDSLVDESLSFEMSVIQQVVTEAHSLREKAAHRTRQPLPELRVATNDEAHRNALAHLGPLATDELNVKQIVVVDELEGLTTLTAKPNFAALGPRFGKDANKVAAAITAAPPDTLRALHEGTPATLLVDGQEVSITPEDVLLQVETAGGWLVGEAGNLRLALATTISPELRREGLARDLVRHLQQLRADTNLNIEDRIDATYETPDPGLKQAISEWTDYIKAETLADSFSEGTLETEARELSLQGAPIKLWLRRKVEV
jgi:isoleucyl-tRNA synthetase